MVVVNMNSNHVGNTRASLALVSVCSDCVSYIQSVHQWSERLKTCLLKAKTRIGHQDWFLLLSKIPTAVAGKKDGGKRKLKGVAAVPKKSDVDFDGAHHNDFLVAKMSRKK